MSVADLLGIAKRVAIRETAGAILRQKAKRAEDAERIAAIATLRAANPTALQPSDFVNAAREWQLDPAVLHALADAESAGRGFDDRDRLLILDEPHVFSFNSAHAFDRSHPFCSYPKWTRYVKDAPPPPGWERHPYQFDADERWGLWELQAELNFDAACCALSGGRFQQMVGPTPSNPRGGWIELQYPSPEALLRKLATSEVDQLEILHRYMTVHDLLPAMRKLDWLSIARRYNGVGQAEAYAARMATGWKKRRAIYNT